MALTDIATAFILGLLTPLTAACVLPLYPGFLAFLSNQIPSRFRVESARNKTLAMLGLVVSAGVILFMFLLGLLFTTIFQVSLTKIIGIVSPIAFGILVIISLILIFDIDLGKFIPKYNLPLIKNKPILSAFLFGLFFGAIVVPCNPTFIAALFARAATITDFATNILSFLFFGLGISAPLIALSIISGSAKTNFINYVTKYKRYINLIAGMIMLIISLYYLIFVFRVLG